jgi:hypothetical protein
MALSGDFNFTLNRDAIIKRALLMLGVISANQTPTSSEVTAASNALNLMLKAWQADGLHLWQVRQRSVSPTSSSLYVFGPSGSLTDYRPTEVLEVHRKNTSDDTWVELNRLSRADFNRLSDHDTTGTPVNYYFNNGRLDAELQIWPIADATFQSDYTLEVLLVKAFDDMDSASDDLAFPPEWTLAIVYGLAVILAPEYGVPIQDQQLLQQQAMIEKERVLSWDREHTSVFFEPEPTFG